MVSVEPRPRVNPTSYRVCWYHSRTRERYRPTYGTVKLAELAYARVKERNHDITDTELDEFLTGHKRHAHVTPTPRIAPTFQEWAEEWLAAKLDVTQKTRQDYAYVLRGRPYRAFGSMRLPAITYDIWMRVVAEASAVLKPSSVFKLNMVVEECLSAAIPQWIPENPCHNPNGKRKRNLPKRKQAEACFLNLDEARLMIDAARPEIADLVDTLFGTGMRLGEALSLQVGDVSVASTEPTPVIYVVDAKTESGLRAVTISRRLADRLAPRTDGRRPTDLMFPDPKGEKWNQSHLRNYYWAWMIAKASRCADHMPPLRTYKQGIFKHGCSRLYEKLDPLSISTCACRTRLHKRPHPHDLRHTHIDWLLNRPGWDWETIARRVGHRHVASMIEMYGNRKRQGDPKALEAIDPMGV